MTYIPPGNPSPYQKIPKMLPERTPNAPSDNWRDCGSESDKQTSTEKIPALYWQQKS